MPACGDCMAYAADVAVANILAGREQALLEDGWFRCTGARSQCRIGYRGTLNIKSPLPVGPDTSEVTRGNGWNYNCDWGVNGVIGVCC